MPFASHKVFKPVVPNLGGCVPFGSTKLQKLGGTQKYRI